MGVCVYVGGHVSGVSAHSCALSPQQPFGKLAPCWEGHLGRWGVNTANSCTNRRCGESTAVGSRVRQILFIRRLSLQAVTSLSAGWGSGGGRLNGGEGWSGCERCPFASSKRSSFRDSVIVLFLELVA